MSGQVDVSALNSYLNHEAQQREKLCLSMDNAIKEIVNFLLPADRILQDMDKAGEQNVTTDRVVIRRDELDSVIHLVSNAHVLLARLRAIFAAASAGEKASLEASQAQPLPAEDVRVERTLREEVRVREETRPRDEWRVRDEARSRDEPRAREETSRPREPLRPIKAA